MNVLLNRELLTTDVKDCLIGSALWVSIEWAIISDIAQAIIG